MVTFTYNDHALVHDLIESVNDWALQPRRIIVVDDGSNVPIRTEKAKIIRLPHNHGFAKAKHVGISAVTGKFILSLDSDIRLDKDWLLKNIQFASRKDVGIVTSGIVYKHEETIVDKYIKYHLNIYPPSGYTSKLNNGGAWIFRKDVWDATGGFNEFSGILSEDIWFSQKVYNFGYKLFSNDAVQAHEIRRFNRYTAIIGLWKGQWKSFRERLNKDLSVRETLSYLLATFKMRVCNKSYRCEFSYIDILLFLYATIETLKKICKDYDTTDACSILISLFKNNLSQYTHIACNLEADITKLFLIESLRNIDHFPFQLNTYSEELVSFFSKECLLKTEKKYLQQIIAEERTITPDYSSYAKA